MFIDSGALSGKLSLLEVVLVGTRVYKDGSSYSLIHYSDTTINNINTLQYSPQANGSLGWETLYYVLWTLWIIWKYRKNIE